MVLFSSIFFSQTEWNQIDKEPLKNKITECIPLLQNHPNMLYRCNYIMKNMDDPWSNSTFKKIISHNGNADEIAGTDQQNEGIINYYIILNFVHSNCIDHFDFVE